MRNFNNKIALFEGKGVRKTWHNDQWYFSVVATVGILTNSANPTDYLKKMRKRDEELGSYIGTNCPQVEMLSDTGKKRKTLAGNTENIFRIIQSIPSPKAEPFKRWLARVGRERIEEIENPELAQERMKAMYEQKGYPKSWIDKRLRGIAIRQDLTDEWEERGAEKNIEHAILINEIMQGTFGMRADEYKEFKSLKRENLRDHMTDLELILTMLGEATTTKLTKGRDSQGFSELQKDAKDGGRIAGKTRKDIELESGESVVSRENYLKMQRKKELKE